MSSGILIVEDEPIVAQDVAAILTGAGYRIAGVAGTVPTALRLARTGKFDAAVVDANLRGESAEAIAAALAEARTPFLVLSGYGRSHIKGALCEAPLLGKPFSGETLVRAVEALHK
jgi:DNA-binding response OmpR family regulator